MSYKALNINQHDPLHELYTSYDCCLCKAEQKIKELEEKIISLREELNQI